MFNNWLARRKEPRFVVFANFDSVNTPLIDNFRLPTDATEGGLGEKGIQLISASQCKLAQHTTGPSMI